MPDVHRLEYERRMHRVLAHIDAHLSESLDLPRLADVAHFSPFHFHRLFAAWMGQTLGDYLRRRRVEVAGVKLLSQPRLTVLQAALDVGFGSSEAFSRAFKSHFGTAPSGWRASRGKHIDFSNPDHDGGRAGSNNGASPLAPCSDAPPVRVIHCPPTQIVYLRHIGPYGPPVNRFWAEEVYPWIVANGLLDRPRYGIGHDDPSVMDPARCRYDACAAAPAGFKATGRSFSGTLPGGRYAVLPFRGNVVEVELAWARLLRDWLPSSGLQLDGRPCYEHYPAGVTDDAGTGVFACDICVPVAPL